MERRYGLLQWRKVELDMGEEMWGWSTYHRL